MSSIHASPLSTIQMEKSEKSSSETFSEEEKTSAASKKTWRESQGFKSSLLFQGEPMLWLTGGALILSLVMIFGLIFLVLANGVTTFWPKPLPEITTLEGKHFLGEITRKEKFQPTKEQLESLSPSQIHTKNKPYVRRLLRTGNFELTGTHFHWVDNYQISEETYPPWALTIERMAWGQFYGFPKSFQLKGETIASGANNTWEAYLKYHDNARELAHHIEDREQLEIIQNRYQMVLTTVDGIETNIALSEIVRAYPANQLHFGQKIKVYLSRWKEYLLDNPREANSEGGVYPAIFGTFCMTLIMTLVVVPFGVLAALYLREYAKEGIMVRITRIAVNNLAGVPSIVFGVFGLGFFCYIMGTSIDQLLFQENLPNPTFGKGGLLWASLTLALLTLPVVIVATEETLAGVPNSLREGSYACGASKWQTIRRIILPRALPGIMTGMILAIARGAGEVAPLMLVGAVKLAPKLPVDGTFPFLHPERSFMHLGFHIFDLAFQSQNSEAAKPMVFTTTLLLIVIVLFLNLIAIWLRGRFRRKFFAAKF